jgi:MoxR-like ATPase
MGCMLDFYRGDGVARDEVAIASPLVTPEMLRAQTDPKGYRLVGAWTGGPDDPSVDDALQVIRAVNVALALRLPLLISGEPGSGKTQLGYAVASELGKPEPLKFAVKSTSLARDLFYEYDAIGHFRTAQLAATKVAPTAQSPEGSIDAVDPRDYIEYSPLGLAILLALPLSERRRFVSSRILNGDVEDDLKADVGSTRARVRQLLRDDRQRQMIVIVDEIDKAPRDFPNDLLHELETMSFRVPELSGLETPALGPAYRPILFVTSNSERQLPEAFLRRCAFVNLPAPRGQLLKDVVTTRLSGMYRAGSPLLGDVCGFYEQMRQRDDLDKPPGTAETIQFLQGLVALGADPDIGLAAQCDIAIHALPLLGKSSDDQVRLTEDIRKFATSPATAI